MTDKNHRCPKCGYADVYVGAYRIECGYDKSCENFSNAQAKEVERLQSLRSTSVEMDDDFGWSDDEDITKPIKYSLNFSD